MPLIKCKECGTEVSDKATSCPKCGAPYPGKSWIDQPGNGCGVIVLGFIIFGAAILLWIWLTGVH